MPYLTPETLPLTHECRRLLIPDSPEWLAIVSGALTELTLKWNWQEKGISVDDAIQAAYAIVDSYYNQPCTDPDACTTEEDTRVIRLVPGGEWQELINGTWQTPEGDYEIEPTPARSESSEIDRLCLASKNSVNSLKALYEEVTDAFDEFGAIEPVIAALLAGIGAVVAAFVSVAAAAFVALGAFAIEQFFQLLGSISYDLWSEDFEEMLYCIFLNNASNDDGVTHFDYDAIVADLNEEMNGLSLDFQRKQLALQVLYLLSIIGKPGIEWAGTTTAVTDDDCSECDTGWCYLFDFDVDDGDWVGGTAFVTTPIGTWDGTKWNYTDAVNTATNPDQGNRGVTIEREFDMTEVTSVEVLFSINKGTFYNSAANCVIVQLGATNVITVTAAAQANGDDIGVAWSGSATVDIINLLIRSSADNSSPYSYSGSTSISRVIMRGNGTNPFGSNNCE